MNDIFEDAFLRASQLEKIGERLARAEESVKDSGFYLGMPMLEAEKEQMRRVVEYIR